MSTIQVTSRQQAEEVLIKKANEDPAFREELLADPRGAIGGLFGVQLPPNITITVLEESAREVYLVLPARGVGEGSGRLSDEDLAKVAGGAEDDDAWKKIKGMFGAESGMADTSEAAG